MYECFEKGDHLLSCSPRDQGSAPRTPSVNVVGIVLAAGKGTRMRSAIPKVLHQVMGRPMLGWVLRSLADAGVERSVLVLGAEHGAFEDFLKQHPQLTLAIQVAQRGTADAVASAHAAFHQVKRIPYAQSLVMQGGKLQATHVLICAGDTPALRGEELSRFISAHADSDIAVLGMQPTDPKGYGRLVLKDGSLIGIIEERDADLATKAIREVNSGVILARKEVLFELLAEVTPNNVQGEYYLTDIVRLGYEKGYRTRVHIAQNAREFAGVNDRAQLAAVEHWMLARAREAALGKGITLHLPETIYIEADVEIGEDTDIAPGVCLYGTTKIGKACHIGARVCLMDAIVGDGVVIGEGSVLRGVTVEQGRVVPPLSQRV